MTQLSGTTWNLPPAEFHLKEDQVHLWRISVTDLKGTTDAQTSVLSAEELERATRFHFEIDRKRFIVSHGTLRMILGQYIGLPPEEIIFGHGDRGKPNLDPVPQNEGVRFNLSHSGDIVLIAVGRHREIGVDVEKIRPEIELERLAQRFFSPGEVESLSSLDTEHRLAAFFRCWTRKEAYIKALGGGLSIPLDQFEVTLEPDTPPALSANREDPDEVARWSLYNIELGEDYLAALAVEGRPEKIQYWHFTLAPLTTETKKT
jgi:4'-phosphopantetheinyl transferase